MQTEPYAALSLLYDTFMQDDIRYDDWALHIRSILEKNGINDGLVCDLGCGSGIITAKLAGVGYDMIGIDSSPEMLMQARERADGSGILYLNQDITSFELYGTVRAFISTCDVINYIIKTEDLEKVFRLVNNYLDPGGIFIFDIHTRYYYEKICASNTFSAVNEDGAYIWENDYDRETGENRYNVTIFVREDTESDEEFYGRFEEEHIEKAYSAAEIKSAAESSGLKVISVTDDYTDATLRPDSTRAVFVVTGDGSL